VKLNLISLFNENRVQIRAYLSYLLERNIPTNLPNISLDTIMLGIKNIRKEIDFLEAIYILDAKGVQVTDTYSPKKGLRKKDKGTNRSSRAYYYRAVRQKKSILTDPYPSILTNQLSITTSMPIYDENNKLLYVVILDISLKDIEKIVYTDLLGRGFIKFNKIAYSLFSLSLIGVAFLLFSKGIYDLFFYGTNKFDLKQMFKSTILLTLSLAIFDLVKTIFEEEVLGKHKKTISLQNKTMAKFLGSIIIALAIEALMLVFKFALTDPTKLLYALYIIVGVTMLLLGLAFYIRFTDEKNITVEKG